MPLTGIKVIEVGSLSPGAVCGKFLRDFGASVILVDKVNNFDFINALFTHKKFLVVVMVS